MHFIDDNTLCQDLLYVSVCQTSCSICAYVFTSAAVSVCIVFAHFSQLHL